MKRTIFLLIVISLFLSPVLAQENMGARPIALGGAFTGLADDANAIFTNPAGIAYAKAEQGTASSKLAQGSEYTILGGVEKTSYGSFGIGYVSSGYNINTLTTITTGDAGTAATKQTDQTIVLSYARQLNDFMVVPESMGRLSLGTNVKLSSVRLANAKGLSTQQGSGIDLDFAALFKANEYLSGGVCLKNAIGAKEKTAISGGLSGQLFNNSLTWSVEEKGLGVECKVLPELALRAGRDGNYGTAGAGINLGGIGIDYAYLAKSAPVHYVGISIAIDPPAREAKQASIDAE